MAEQLLTVSVSELHESPDNTRINFGDIDGLAKSIDAQELIEPIIVRKRAEGGYWIVAGARRNRALKKLGRKKTDVILREYTRQQAFEVMVAENAHREDTNPIELAGGLAKMREDFGLDGEQIAERVKLPRTTVYDLLTLHDNLFDAAKKLILGGKLDAQHGVQFARVRGERLQNAAVVEAMRLAKDGEKPPVRALKRLIQDKYLATAKRGLSKRQRETREHGEDVALRRRVVQRLLARVAELVERRANLDETDLRTMALATATAEPNRDATREVFERRSLGVSRLAKVGATQLRSLVVELALAPFVALDGGEYSAGAKAVSRAYGLSLAELEKGVAAETKAEALFEKK